MCPQAGAGFCDTVTEAGAGFAAHDVLYGEWSERWGREAVRVVGYDNWSPMVLGSDPPLTSVDMCLEHLGRVAAEHLMLAINGEPTHGVHTVPCRLVSRDSTVMKVSAMATG